MILFSEIIEQLESAEQTLQSVTDPKTGIFKREKYNRLITLINAAMVDLHLKFTLKQGECTLLTQPDKYLYPITKDMALSVNPLGYIIDTVEEPFTDAVTEITGVKSIDQRQLPFNITTPPRYPNDYNGLQLFSVYDERAIFKSPKQGVLRVPVGLQASQLILSYKVGPEPIKRIPDGQLATFDPAMLVIPMTDIFTMPIVFYCCSRLGNARGNERAGQSVYSEGSSYYSKYLSECANIQSNLSLANEIHEPVSNFYRQGFV